MGLVDYSDSEGSDSEPKQSQTLPSAKPSTSRSAFHKVVDKSNPRKIKVDLPTSAFASPNKAVSQATGPDADDGPPSKRARIGGGFGGGFNSFLPAPKNAGKSVGGTLSDNAAIKPRGTAPGRGVSLKTGAAPAFSREMPLGEAFEDNIEDLANTELLQLEDVVENNLYHTDGDHSAGVGPVPVDDQPQPKRAMFKPLSVARKPERKKRKPPLADQNAKTLSEIDRNSVTAAPTPPLKKSLFSTTETETEQSMANASDGQYHPFFEDEPSMEDTPSNEAELPNEPLRPPPPSNHTDLVDLANTLNLTPAQRRELFGRTGAPTSAQVSQFSVSEEYSHNQAMLAQGEANAAAAPKTVRSIAPGKHSLQQLLNQANSQRDALEESFQRGKTNRKDASSRYGW